MNPLLKLRKHRLAEHRSLELIQEIIQQEDLLLFLFCMLQQIADQQRLIAGGSHLCDKEAVLCIRKRLCMIRIPGMQRMAHFMRQCEDRIDISVKAHQHIRMGIVRTPGVSTALFSFVLINIHPALRKALVQQCHIIIPEHGKRFLHDLDRLLIRIFLLVLFRQRNVNIIHMKFIHTEQLFTQCHVAVHRRHFCMDRLEQLVVNRNRDISAIQRCSQCRWIFSYICKECGLFQIGTERCGEHVFVFFILRIILLKRFFSDPAVLRL